MVVIASVEYMIVIVMLMDKYNMGVRQIKHASKEYVLKDFQYLMAGFVQPRFTILWMAATAFAVPMIQIVISLVNGYLTAQTGILV